MIDETEEASDEEYDPFSITQIKLESNLAYLKIEAIWLPYVKCRIYRTQNSTVPTGK